MRCVRRGHGVRERFGIERTAARVGSGSAANGTVLCGQAELCPGRARAERRRTVAALSCLVTPCFRGPQRSEPHASAKPPCRTRTRRRELRHPRHIQRAHAKPGRVTSAPERSARSAQTEFGEGSSDRPALAGLGAHRACSLDDCTNATRARCAAPAPPGPNSRSSNRRGRDRERPRLPDRRAPGHRRGQTAQEPIRSLAPARRVEYRCPPGLPRSQCTAGRRARGACTALGVRAQLRTLYVRCWCMLSLLDPPKRARRLRADRRSRCALSARIV